MCYIHFRFIHVHSWTLWGGGAYRNAKMNTRKRKVVAFSLNLVHKQSTQEKKLVKSKNSPASGSSLPDLLQSSFLVIFLSFLVRNLSKASGILLICSILLKFTLLLKFPIIFCKILKKDKTLQISSILWNFSDKFLAIFSRKFLKPPAFWGKELCFGPLTRDPLRSRLSGQPCHSIWVTVCFIPRLIRTHWQKRCEMGCLMWIGNLYLCLSQWVRFLHLCLI